MNQKWKTKPNHEGLKPLLHVGELVLGLYKDLLVGGSSPRIYLEKKKKSWRIEATLQFFNLTLVKLKDNWTRIEGIWEITNWKFYLDPTYAVDYFY